MDIHLRRWNVGPCDKNDSIVASVRAGGKVKCNEGLRMRHYYRASSVQLKKKKKNRDTVYLTAAMRCFVA